MLTRETYPSERRLAPAIDGGFYRPGLRLGVLKAVSGWRGKFHEEREVGFESCVVDLGEGEVSEVYLTDTEVGIGYAGSISAYYDRETGSLNTACLSLTRAILALAENEVRLNRRSVRLAKEMLADDRDVVVIVNFDGEGEVKTSIVKTEAGVVTGLLGMGLTENMNSDYRWFEDEEEEDDDLDEYGAMMVDEASVDFVLEGEDDWVGYLIMAWRHECEILGVDLGIGVRTVVMDFVLVDNEGENGAPFHVSQELDFDVFDGRPLDTKLTQELVSQAFPELDWF